MIKVLFVVCLFALARAAPGVVQAQKSFQASGAVSANSPITFDGSNVGVDFAGYHASAGLGGLLTGDTTKGGLHAEAGTPFGQEAGAGIAGVVDANGGTKGGLYAGANAGGSVGASAGLAGETGAAVYGQKTIHQNTQVISQKSYTQAPKVIHEQTYQAAPVVHRTVIEKTVIPQYVEKTIQVPSYVEKTIRVPTVEEHKVRVPVTPKIVERTYDEGASAYAHNFNARAGADISGHKVALVERPTTYVHKEYNAGGGGGGLLGGFLGGRVAFGGSAGAGAAAGGGPAVGGGGYGYKSSTFFNDIFNIPISTLGAVNNLLNGLNTRTSGGFHVSKHYGIH